MADYGSKVIDRLIYDACNDWKLDKRTKKNDGKETHVSNLLGFNMAPDGSGDFVPAALKPRRRMTNKQWAAEVKNIVPKSDFGPNNALRRAHNFKNAIYLLFLLRFRNALHIRQEALADFLDPLDDRLKKYREELKKLKEKPRLTNDDKKRIKELKQLIKEDLKSRKALLPDLPIDVTVTISFKEGLIHHSDPEPGSPPNGVDTVISGGMNTDDQDVNDLVNGFGQGNYLLYCGD